jgi:putative salt-induced outer membrane protein YdiY
MVLFGALGSMLAAGGKITPSSTKEEIRDTIVVHGMVLHGKVVGLGPERLSFKLNYAEGVNQIKYEDIESIHTKYNYHISFKRIDIEGRVVGIEENKFLNVIDSDGHERLIKIADIDNFVMSVQSDDSFENRIRNQFPYTKGTVSLGLETENGNSKKNKIDLMIDTRYKKAENEVLFYLDYAYETTQTEDIPQVRNKDELSSFVSYRYHVTNKMFYYSALMAEYDKPRHIDALYIPSVGVGHRFKFGKDKWLEPALGIGYANIDYTEETYSDKSFNVAALGLLGRYQFDDLTLINQLIVSGFLVYYPSIENGFNDDWVLRSNLSFTVPLFDFFSVKLVFDLINDSNPDPEVGNNKSKTKLLFGIDF